MHHQELATAEVAKLALPDSTLSVSRLLSNRAPSRCGCSQKGCCSRLASQKFLPVVAGYRIDSFKRLSGPMMKTALAVRGMPSLSFSSGSNIPYLHMCAVCWSEIYEFHGQEGTAGRMSSSPHPRMKC